MDEPALARRLGTTDAVVIGLGSMIGAGVFSAFGPAARAAGAGLLIGLVLAAVIAYCNATASAQLAAVYPTSGGTYIYGRERLGPWWGFIAGWGFVIGKTASCAAMALTVATYAIPGGPLWVQRIVAVAAVVALAALNYRGVTKTAVLARILLACTLIALTAVVVGHRGRAAGAVAPDARRLAEGHDLRGAAVGGAAVFRVRRLCADRDDGRRGPRPGAHHPHGRSRSRWRSRWPSICVVGVAALLAAGPDRLAHAAAPLAEAVRAAGAAPLVPVVAVGGALASLGALLALIAGLGRTALAMARHRDLPALAGRRSPAPPGTAPRRDRARRGRLRLGGHRRPARGDRLFVVRGVDLLRDRQRGRVYASRRRRWCGWNVCGLVGSWCWTPWCGRRGLGCSPGPAALCAVADLRCAGFGIFTLAIAGRLRRSGQQCALGI